MEDTNEDSNKNEATNNKIDLINIGKSICKILTNEKKGTGFFIKLNKNNEDFYCLMTNQNLISKEMVAKKQKLIIYYDSEKKNIGIILNRDKRYIKEYKNINITIIEIIKKDNINEKYFLLPYIGENNIMDKSIYIVQFLNEKLCYSSGKIIKMDKSEITHDINTKYGSSGSPIFLENTKLVIGIHKQGNNKINENYGDLLYPIILEFKPKINYDNGNYYKGDVINGISHGKGILYDKNGNIKYEGDFINGNAEGNGIYYYDNGEYYIGQWKKDLKNGKGILYYRTGNIKYEGDFINGKAEGNGKYYSENGDYYIGQFKNGLSHGKGIEYYKNGNIMYEGDFINGKREGNGKYYYESDNYYIGQFKNNLKNGKGILYYKNGNIMFEGDFIDGKRERNEKKE